MTASPKLSPAQADLLAELPVTCDLNYRPAVKLVEMGLAHWQAQQLGGWRLLPGPKAPRKTP